MAAAAVPTATVDPLVQDLTTAQPSDIEVLAGTYAAAAEKARFTAEGLRAAAQDTQWEGHAADRFRTTIGELPRQLTLLCNGYYDVAGALRRYANQLPELQAAYAQATSSLSTVQAELTQAQARLTTDTDTLRALLAPGSGATERAKRAAQSTVGVDASAVQTLQRDITGHHGNAEQILEEFRSLRTAASMLIEEASQYAVRPVRITGGQSGLGAAVDAVTHDAVGSAGRAVPVPVSVRERLAAMHGYVRSVMGTPYVWGGGHGSFTPNGGLDCSGFVSGTLHSAGFLHTPQTTEGLPTQPGIQDGPGRYVTIYDRTGQGGNDHVIIDINGTFYEEGGGAASGGAQCVHQFTPTAAYLQSFNRILHPVGM